jgi:nucleoside-diphosphate-sugar epimerase
MKLGWRSHGLYNDRIGKDFKDLDLRRQGDVEDFFEVEKPECVILAAAKVGGIHANNTLVLCQELVQIKMRDFSS